MESEENLDESVEYYRRHAPERVRAKVGLRAWQPIIEEMIDGELETPEMMAWMAAHHQALGIKPPSTETLKKWVSGVRKKMGKSLRIRKPRSSSSAALGQNRRAQVPVQLSVDDSAQMPQGRIADSVNENPSKREASMHLSAESESGRWCQDGKSQTDHLHSENELQIDPETGFPDLFQLPVVEIPSNCKSQEAFTNALKPLFAERKEKLASMHEIFSKIHHDRRHEIYLNALAALDPSDTDAFLCHYADVEVILRADNPYQPSWQSGISSGRRKLREN